MGFALNCTWHSRSNGRYVAIMNVRQSLVAGSRSVLPILVGVVPFGLIYGVVAVSEGLGKITAILMSSIVFAGASQIAAAELWGQGAPLAIVVATGLVINVRFLMYSASLAPHLRGLSPWQRWFGSYLLTDQAYAVSVLRFQDTRPIHHFAFYCGAGLTLWTTWQSSSVLGVLVGLQVPPSWGLEFSVPLMFLALLVPSLQDRTSVVVAIVSGIAALLFYRLPLHMGLMAAATLALLVGAWLERSR